MKILLTIILVIIACNGYGQIDMSFKVHNDGDPIPKNIQMELDKELSKPEYQKPKGDYYACLVDHLYKASDGVYYSLGSCYSLLPEEYSPLNALIKKVDSLEKIISQLKKRIDEGLLMPYSIHKFYPNNGKCIFHNDCSKAKEGESHVYGYNSLDANFDQFLTLGADKRTEVKKKK